MNISLEEKKAEAIKRLKMFNIYGPTIASFKDGYLSTTEQPLGATFWMDGEELELVRKFEKEYNALVYLVVRTYTTIGKMDSYLFVSDYREEWENDRELIDENVPFVYVHNYDAPDNSEFGSICVIRSIAGGLLRTL